VVSFGLPFPPGALSDDTQIKLIGDGNTEVPVHSQVLARWPADQSLRSVVVAFRVTLPNNATRQWRIEYGVARGASAGVALTPNPDGPVAATLSAAWYSASQVSGRLVPVQANARFSAFDTKLLAGLGEFDLADFQNDCGSTSSHRTYYDGPHAIYQLFLRTGDHRHYRRARDEAVWYRANELRWHGNDTMAVQNCQPAGWTPQQSLQWDVLRRMLSQGMLDDYLITGDPEAARTVRGLGEAYRRNLPALMDGGANSDLEATERNMGWTLMGLASHYALDPQSAQLSAAMKSVVDRAVQWQSRGSSGAFEHDLNRADPLECDFGPAGASPFMTSLLIDGLMDYYQLTRDPRTVEVVRRSAEWYSTQAITSDRKAFRYLWNCTSNAYNDSEETDELNLMIAHVFGAAYALTGDGQWLTFGDQMVDHGIAGMFVKRPKQWNQASRSFGKYLGYRSLSK
jgi:Beta-L-arabinofuranosidase, GH127